MSAGQELDEGQLRDMLGSRTKSLIERIDRNIKIGFVAKQFLNCPIKTNMCLRHELKLFKIKFKHFHL